MSKNFEEEYKALANEDLPDLWNRIESGLTPKTTALTDEVEDKQVITKTKKEKVISVLYRYRAVAAAVLCAVVIIPAVAMSWRSGRSKNWEAADEAPSIDMAAAQNENGMAVVTEGVAEDAAGAIEEAAVEDAGEITEEIMADSMENCAEDTATMDDSAATMPEAEMAAMPKDEPSGGAGVDAAGETEKKLRDKETQQLSNAREESAKAEAEEESVKVYENVTLKMEDRVDEIVETDEGIYSGVKAKVVKDPQGELTEGAEITVWISCASSVAYMKGETYSVTISYNKDRMCPYRIL